MIIPTIYFESENFQINPVSILILTRELRITSNLKHHLQAFTLHFTHATNLHEIESNSLINFQRKRRREIIPRRCYFALPSPERRERKSIARGAARLPFFNIASEIILSARPFIPAPRPPRPGPSPDAFFPASRAIHAASARFALFERRRLK